MLRSPEAPFPPYPPTMALSRPDVSLEASWTTQTLFIAKLQAVFSESWDAWPLGDLVSEPRFLMLFCHTVPGMSDCTYGPDLGGPGTPIRYAGGRSEVVSALPIHLPATSKGLYAGWFCTSGERLLKGATALRLGSFYIVRRSVYMLLQICTSVRSYTSGVPTLHHLQRIVTASALNVYTVTSTVVQTTC